MNKKILIVKIVTFLSGLYFFLEFILPPKFLGINLGENHEIVSVAFIAMGGVAVGLGIINLLLLHLNKIFLKKKNYFFSICLLLSLFSMLVVLSLDWYMEAKNISKAKVFQVHADFANVILKDDASKKKGVLDKKERNKILVTSLLKELEKVNVENFETKNTTILPSEKENLTNTKNEILSIVSSIQNDDFDTKFNENLSKKLRKFNVEYKEILVKAYSTSIVKKIYLFFFNGLFNPLATAMFSLLGFYVATAAYRAFKIRSLESFLMMLSALIVILGQVPFGMKLWDGFPSLRLWLLSVPSTAAFRAISLGAFVASLVMALRMWFSMEQSGAKEKNTKGGNGK